MISKVTQQNITHPVALRWARHSESQISAGYTLIELLVVIVLLATLIGAGIPLYTAYIEKARITRAEEEISTLQKEIQMYKLSKKVLPRKLSDIRESDLMDPYGRPYQYHNFTSADEKEKRRKDRFLVPLNADYDLYSMGRDGKSEPPLAAKESHDDIVRANEGIYIGPVSEF
ncbi:MAG: prepilin-type N-terminal cleavage/methylation domain-containing protein [Desulfobacteraceae bacterium]|jgi:general secretion pathway protein G